MLRAYRKRHLSIVEEEALSRQLFNIALEKAVRESKIYIRGTIIDRFGNLLWC